VHHSGSGWLARPSPWGTCTSYSLPASWRTLLWVINRRASGPASWLQHRQYRTQGTTLSIRAPVQISTAAEIQRFDRLLKARTTYMSADARRRIWESTMSLEERLEHYGRILPLPDEKPEAEAQPNEFADLQPAAKSDIVESEPPSRADQLLEILAGTRDALSRLADEKAADTAANDTPINRHRNWRAGEMPEEPPAWPPRAD
jgi:hypothetical protein